MIVFYLGVLLFLCIFELCYLDMVCDCICKDVGFGVCLILDGFEVGDLVLLVVVGMVVMIIDFYIIEEGLFGIVVCGGVCFCVECICVCVDGLLCGEV